MSVPAKAVFLSYASQDADAARRICSALQETGIEVWFDQSELRGGDAWDQKIRRQIRECALFIPLISEATRRRGEGYFRLEWKLATDRSHLMASDQPFLFPVVIDDTTDRDARVPDAFTDVQWTRLPAGAPTPDFTARVRKLLDGDDPPHSSSASGAPSVRAPSPARRSTGDKLVPALVALAVLLAVGGFYLWAARSPGKDTNSATAASADNAFSPPPHSIAVLAFTNMSGSKDDEYFSDGLAEELLDRLVRIETLQVAARASSFSFKDKSEDIGTIARTLNVATVLDGSVRRSGERVRVTTKLINARSGYHMWSETYDRSFSDIFELQSNIASAVAGALRVTLLGERDVGGTRNPQAFDAYLRGRAAKIYESQAANHAGLEAYNEAIRLDPGYALAHAGRATALVMDANTWVTDEKEWTQLNAQARAAAEKAVALAPDSAGAAGALAMVLAATTLDIVATDRVMRRALMLEPGNADVLLNYGRFAVALGHADALDDVNRLVALSPVDSTAHVTRGIVLYHLRRYAEARESLMRGVALNDSIISRFWLAALDLVMGNTAAAIESCKPYAASPGYCQPVLAIAYRKVGRKNDAVEMLKQVKAGNEDNAPYLQASIHAQWGDIERALDLLELSRRLEEPYLGDIRVDPLLDPLRNQPRFAAIVSSLHWPDATVKH